MPMSSPQMTRILGCFLPPPPFPSLPRARLGAVLAADLVFARVAMFAPGSNVVRWSLKSVGRRRRRIDGLPVVLHADDGPPVRRRLVPALVELLQLVRAVVRKLASRVVVVDEE